MNTLKKDIPFLLIPILLATYFYIPLLAGGPLNPDGGELILTAKNGGVLHPPGFPTQSWVNLFLELLLPFKTHTNLLIGILSFQIINCFLLYYILKKLQTTSLSIISCLITYALLPNIWSLSIQVEKYILLVMLMFMAILVWLNWLNTKNKKYIFLFAFIWGLALGHHHFAIVLTPFSIQILFSDKNKASDKLIALSILLIVSISLFLSMLLLTKNNVLPDWGKLQTVTDIINHLLRKDISIDEDIFGFLNIGYIRTLDIFFDELKTYFYLPLLISLIGISSLRNENQKYFPILISFLASLGFLFLLGYKPSNTNSYMITYFRRYSVIPVPFLMVLFGLGISKIKNHQNLFNKIYIVIILILAFRVRPMMNFSGPSLIDLHSSSLGKLIPKRAFYIGTSDEQILYGATQKDYRRFPIRTSHEKWYLERALPLIDNRIVSEKKSPDNLSLKELVKMLHKKEQLIVTTDNSYSKTFFQHGILYSNKKIKSDISPVNIICDDLSKLKKVVQLKYQEFEYFLGMKYYLVLSNICKKKINEDQCNIKEFSAENFKTICDLIKSR